VKVNIRCIYLLLRTTCGVFICTFAVFFAVAPSMAQAVRDDARTDSLWALEQLDDETLEEVPLAAEARQGAGALHMRYAVLAEPDPGQARTHAELEWAPAPWVRMKTSIVRQGDEPFLFDPRKQWLGGEHTMGFVELHTTKAHLILGDFRFRSAASVSDFTSRSVVRSRSHPARSQLRHTDVRPYAGAAEGPAPRGAALRVPLAVGVRLDAFLSRRREDEGAARRSLRVAAHGFGLRFIRPDYSASVSWTQFSFGTSRLSWKEAALSLHPRRFPLRAGMGFAQHNAHRAHLRTADVTLALAAASVTLWRHVVPAWDISPWGAGSRFTDRDQHVRSKGIAVRSQIGATSWFVTGFSTASVTRLAPTTTVLSRSDAYIRVDADRFAVEWRIVEADEDRVAAAAPRVRLRTSEPVRRNRTTVTLHGPSASRWHWSLRALAAHSRAVSAQLRRTGKRRTILLTRAMSWGHAPEPWAVIYTDRMPGRMGLLRASRPRTVQIVRLEHRGLSGHAWTMAISLESDMDSGRTSSAWALGWRF